MVQLFIKVDVATAKLFFPEKSENVELRDSSQFDQKQENSNLKSKPVEMWLHGSIMLFRQ